MLQSKFCMSHRTEQFTAKTRDSIKTQNPLMSPKGQTNIPGEHVIFVNFYGKTSLTCKVSGKGKWVFQSRRVFELTFSVYLGFGLQKSSSVCDNGEQRRTLSGEHVAKGRRGQSGHSVLRPSWRLVLDARLETRRTLYQQIKKCLYIDNSTLRRG